MRLLVCWLHDHKYTLFVRMCVFLSVKEWNSKNFNFHHCLLGWKELGTRWRLRFTENDSCYSGFGKVKRMSLVFFFFFGHFSFAATFSIFLFFCVYSLISMNNSDLNSVDKLTAICQMWWICFDNRSSVVGFRQNI